MRNSLLNRLDYKMRDPAWVMVSIVVLAFVVSPLVDIDHPIAWVLGIPNERFLLAYFDAVSYWAIGCGLILAITCICRCACIRFLRRHSG